MAGIFLVTFLGPGWSQITQTMESKGCGDRLFYYPCGKTNNIGELTALMC